MNYERVKGSLRERVLLGARHASWKSKSAWTARKYWDTRPDRDFARQGFAVVPNFLPREECDRLRALADSLLRGESYRIESDAYTTARHEMGLGRDLHVEQVVNLQSIDDGVKALLDSGRVQRELEARLGEPTAIRGFTIQVDGVDTKTKRGYHLDGGWPPTFKAFVYLNDVNVMGDGPYTVVPGSHRHVARKVLHQIINAAGGLQKDDMHVLYRDFQSHSFLAPAGTLILSTQDVVHKGWHHQDRQKRYVLIGTLVLARYYDGTSVRLGAERIKKDAGHEPRVDATAPS